MTEIAEQEDYDVTKFDGTQLIDLMRQTNNERESSAGIIWWLHRGRDEPDCLIAGVRGDYGVLNWEDSTDLYVPKHGLNIQTVDYFTPMGHHYIQRPGREVPIDVVYKVVAEFVETQRKPETLEWKPFTWTAEKFLH